MINHLYSSLKKDLPNYPIIKDLFDQIDIRKDGIIDFNEWSKTFLQDKNFSANKLNFLT